MNAKTYSHRVQTFLDWVVDSFPEDVAKAFATSLEQSADPMGENLSVLLGRAKQSSQSYIQRERASLKSFELPFCSA